jgi:hypothetical protein
MHSPTSGLPLLCVTGVYKRGWVILNQDGDMNAHTDTHDGRHYNSIINPTHANALLLNADYLSIHMFQCRPTINMPMVIRYLESSSIVNGCY